MCYPGPPPELPVHPLPVLDQPMLQEQHSSCLNSQERTEADLATSKKKKYVNLLVLSNLGIHLIKKNGSGYRALTFT